MPNAPSRSLNHAIELRIRQHTILLIERAPEQRHSLTFEICRTSQRRDDERRRRLCGDAEGIARHCAAEETVAGPHANARTGAARQLFDRHVERAAAVALPICDHDTPASLLNSIATCSASLSASVAVHAMGTVPLVKSSPPAGLLIETIGALLPALKLSSTSVPVIRSIRATPLALGTFAEKNADFAVAVVRGRVRPLVIVGYLREQRD